MYQIGTATDYENALELFSTFLTQYGSAHGFEYVGTGNGVIAGPGLATRLATGIHDRGGATSIAETWEITATSATNWTVVGSISGSIGPATTGSDFSHAKISFRITAGGTAFIAGDKFTCSTAPPWIERRKSRGCVPLGSLVTTGQKAAENVIDGKTVADSARDWVPGAAAWTHEVTFYVAETITHVFILPTGTAGPTAFTIEKWNGSSWDVLATFSGVSWTSGVGQEFAITSPASYLRYRVNATAGASPNISAIKWRRSSNGIDAAFSQYIWEAPGNDGASPFYFGAHHFRRLDIDYFNLEVAAFTGYTAALAYYAQPGIHRHCYVPLQNSSTPFWFRCDGQSAWAVFKVGSQYEGLTLNALDPFFTPDQFPYPIAIGGSLALGAAGTIPNWNSTNWRWSNTAATHSLFSHADGGTGAPVAEACQMRARAIDGIWAGFYAAIAGAYGSTSASGNVMWPQNGDYSLLDVNLDGSYSIYPIMLCHAAPNILGVLNGVGIITGQGITAETMIRQGMVDWIAIPNIHRTGARHDWTAFRLD